MQARAYGDEVRAMSKKAGMTMTWQYLYSLANLGYIELLEGNIATSKTDVQSRHSTIPKSEEISNGVIYSDRRTSQPEYKSRTT